MGITAGLTSIREVAALFSPTDNIQKPANSPDCLLNSPDCFLNEVTQPSYSRLCETLFEYDVGQYSCHIACVFVNNERSPVYTR